MSTSHPGIDPRALMSLPPHDPFSPYAQGLNPFSPPAGSAANNPFSPVSTTASSSYFAMDPHAAPVTHPHPHMRPAGPQRPQSFIASTQMSYPDNAMAPYYPPGYPGLPHAMYPGGPHVHPHHPHYPYMYPGQQHAPSPPPEKPTTPVVAAPVEKVDDAARIFAMFTELEEKKAAAAKKEADEKEAKAAKEAALKELKETESAKIELMLKKWEEERVLREQEKIAKAEAEAAAKAAVDARDAAISDAAKKAKEEAEKDAAEAAKKAAEEHEKKLAEIQKAAEEHEKKKKELEEELAKSKPDPDSAKAPIKFKDAVNRNFYFPWTLAKTWKVSISLHYNCVSIANAWQGMEGLIKQAFLHVDTVGPHVMEGHYDLIGPDNEIILPQVWEIVVQPGWDVMMELWPMPDPELIAVAPPGAFPVLPPKRERPKVTKKETKIRVPRHVDPSPAVMEAMPPPPPMASHHHRMPAAPMAHPDDIIEVIEEGSSSKPSKSHSTKRKDPKVGPFTSWMIGGGLRRSGKGSEKPEVSQQQLRLLVQPRSPSPAMSRALVKHDADDEVQRRIRAAYVRHSEVPQMGCTIS